MNLSSVSKGIAYAGIGSRETPDHIQHVMAHIAGELEKLGLTLRSGGADGADDAFERGVVNPENKEIYLPWPRFNGRCPSLCTSYIVPNHPAAMEIARKYHPAWDRLKPGAQSLMARNTHQILGRNLDDPVEFVICWTRRGLGQGGTGQAIRIAKAYEIPVFDMGCLTLQQLEDNLNALLS